MTAETWPRPQRPGMIGRRAAAGFRSVGARQRGPGHATGVM
jgi:hypothetical protein